MRSQPLALPDAGRVLAVHGAAGAKAISLQSLINHRASPLGRMAVSATT